MASRATDASFYDQPHVVSDVLIAFPGELGDLLPDEKIIPEEYRGRMTGDPWVDWQAEWFFKGLKQAPIPTDGVDRDLAMRHLSCIQRSFEPSHEHKAAAVAWLASRWFSSPGNGEGGS